jgi:hypothetical protein
LEMGSDESDALLKELGELAYLPVAHVCVCMPPLPSRVAANSRAWLSCELLRGRRVARVGAAQ